MQFSGPCWAHTINLLGLTGAIVLRWWGYHQNQTQQNPKQRLHSTGGKHGCSLEWQQAIPEALICLLSLFISTHWCAASFIKIQIRSTKPVLLLVPKSQRSQQGAGSSSNAMAASRYLSSFLLSWGNNRGERKANWKHSSHLGLPTWIKAQAACPFPSSDFLRTMKCTFKECLLCLWKKSYSTSIIVFPASSITQFLYNSTVWIIIIYGLPPFYFHIFIKESLLEFYVCCQEKLPIQEERLFITLMAALLLTEHSLISQYGKLLSLCSFGTYSSQGSTRNDDFHACITLTTLLVISKEITQSELWVMPFKCTPVAPKCPNDLQSVSYHFHVFWQQLKDTLQFAWSNSHPSDLSDTVSHFINPDFGTSNDHRTVDKAFSHTCNLPIALQSAPLCAAGSWGPELLQISARWATCSDCFHQSEEGEVTLPASEYL